MSVALANKELICEAWTPRFPITSNHPCQLHLQQTTYLHIYREELSYTLTYPAHRPLTIVVQSSISSAVSVATLTSTSSLLIELCCALHPCICQTLWGLPTWSATILELPFPILRGIICELPTRFPSAGSTIFRNALVAHI